MNSAEQLVRTAREELNLARNVGRISKKERGNARVQELKENAFDGQFLKGAINTEKYYIWIC